jgi:hypothetical protein
VAVIGNYLPRRCGIATFTTDLVEGLSAQAPDMKIWAAAMNDRSEGYLLNKKDKYKRLAEHTVRLMKNDPLMPIANGYHRLTLGVAQIIKNLTQGGMQ